jgi:aryl-alcohol dehydrogenase-like predicted oxidoreductase
LKLGLGTWQLGGADFVNQQPVAWGHIEEAEAIDLLLFAFESGIRFIDTADSYGQGLSESRIGKALLQNCPSDIHICTKVGNVRKNGQNYQDFSSTYIKEAVFRSLDRLKCSKIDTLLLHSPPDNINWAGFDKQALEDLKAQGCIGRYGLSAKSVYGAAAAVQAGFGTSVEVIYNMLDRRAEQILFPLKELQNYQVIGRVPYASGFLAAAGQRLFAKDDYRSTMAARDCDWLWQSTKNLHWLANEANSLQQCALRFVLDNTHINYVIPGARQKTQLEQSLRVLEMPSLSAEIKYKIIESVPDVPLWWKPA